METQTFYRLIEDETPILPDIAAESVVGHYYSENKIPITNEQENRQYDELVSYLTKRANDLYNLNAHFKKQIRKPGNKGLDNLYMFMNHWLEAKLQYTKKIKAKRNKELLRALSDCLVELLEDTKRCNGDFLADDYRLYLD
jgi:hypothetical protein